MIAFYYGLTGFACTIYYRRELTVGEDFFLIGVGPTLGGLILLACSSSRASTSPTRRTRSPATPGSASAAAGHRLGFLLMGAC